MRYPEEVSTSEPLTMHVSDYRTCVTYCVQREVAHSGFGLTGHTMLSSTVQISI